jgi:predicted RNA-binding protein YlxR (DUF448 family)
VLTSISDTRRKRNQRKAYIFVDLKKAYDSVKRDVLFRALWRRCQSDQERSVVKILYRLFYRTEVEYGDSKFITTKGVA